MAGGEGDFGLQQVLAGFDQQHIHATLDEGRGLLAISSGHGVVADVAQRRQLGRGAERAGDEARLVGSGVFIGNFAGQARCGKIQLMRAIGEIVLGKYDARRSKAVRLYYIATSIEKRGVNRADDVGPREHEQLIAALLAPKILGCQIALLHIGAQRAVEDQHALFQL